MPYRPPSGTHRAATRANVGPGSPVRLAGRSPPGSPAKQAVPTPPLGKVRVAPSPSLVSSQAASPTFSTVLASRPGSPGKSHGKLDIIEKYREAARQKATAASGGGTAASGGKARLDSIGSTTTLGETPGPETPAPAVTFQPPARRGAAPAEQRNLAEQSRLDRIRSSPKYAQGRPATEATGETNPTFTGNQAAFHKHAARWDALQDRRQAGASADDSARRRGASQPPSPASSSRCGTAPPTPGRPPAASRPNAEKSWPSNGCGKMISRAPASLVGQAVFGQAPVGERVMPGTLDPGIGDVVTAGVGTVDFHSGTGIGRRMISGGERSLGELEQPNKLWGSKSKAHVEKPRGNEWEGVQLSARGEPGSLMGADGLAATWSDRAGSSRGLSTRGKRCLSANAGDTSERLCFIEPISPRDDRSSTGDRRSPRLERSVAAKLINGESNFESCSGPQYEALGAWSHGAAGSHSWEERPQCERPLPGTTFTPKRCPLLGGSPDTIGPGETERAHLDNVFQDYAGQGTWDRSRRSEAEGKHIHPMDAKLHGSGRSQGPLPRGLAGDSGSIREARGPPRSCEDVCRKAAQLAAAPTQGMPTGDAEGCSKSIKIYKGAAASNVPLAGCADAGTGETDEFFSRFHDGPSGHAGSRSWQPTPRFKGQPELSPRCRPRKVISIVPAEQWLDQDPGPREPSTPSKRNDSKRFAAVLSARECPPDRPDDGSAYGCPSTYERPSSKAMPQSPGVGGHPFLHSPVARDEPPQYCGIRRSPEPSTASFNDAAGVRRYSSCEPRARRPAPFGCDAD